MLQCIKRASHGGCSACNLDVEAPADKWPIFGRFLTLFPLKRPARREKNTSRGLAVTSPFFRADKNVLMHLIKQRLRHQDLEGIHLPSFRFSWKLKKLCRVDLFVFESLQTAEDVMVLPYDFNAVCHDSKTKKSTL
jgi:hypothetical protein